MARRASLWSVEISDSSSGEELVEVFLSGAWFADADDLDDAEGILASQKASGYTLVDRGRQEERTL